MTLAAENLSYGYPGKCIGSEVNLSLGAGEALCVLGPNGGGKTTLFRTLLGLLPAQRGMVLLDDVLLYKAIDFAQTDLQSALILTDLP